MAVEETLPEKERVTQKIMPRIAVARAEKFSLKKVLVPALAAMAVVAAGIIAWRLLFPTQITIPTSPDRLRVAVLPFKNNSGDMDLDYISRVISSNLTTDLMQSKYISVADESQVYGILTRLKLEDPANLTQDNLREIARETNVTHILKGNYVKLGDKFRVDAQLQDAGTLEFVTAEREDGMGEEALFSMVDSLTKKIKPHFNLTDEEIANDLDENIAGITSNNPRAIYFYTEGLKALNNRDFSKAIDSLNNAISLDPDFAMAYRVLSGTYNRLALEVGDTEKYWPKLIENRKKALEAIKRRPVSERERLYIEASNQGFVETIQTLFKLVEIYPDDENGNLMLGTILNQQQEYELAKECFEPLVRNKSNNQLAYFHLASIYQAQGLYKEAREISEISIGKFQNPMDYERMISTYIKENDFDNALKWCNKGYELDPIEFTKSGLSGHVYHFSGDFTQAEEEYHKQKDSDSQQAQNYGIRNLIDVYKTQGRFTDILKIAEESLPKDQERLQEMAYAYTAKGDFSNALKQCEEMKSGFFRSWYLGELSYRMQLWQKFEELQKENEKGYTEFLQKDASRDWPIQLGKSFKRRSLQRAERISLRLKGILEIGKGNFDRAIEHLEQAKSLFRNLHDGDLAFFVEPLALAYFKKGDLEKAREAYESIGMMTYGRKNHGDIYAKSFYMLGKIYEELGKKREARRNYERFLELWKNADPGLPEVDDAKERLAAL